MGGSNEYTRKLYGWRDSQLSVARHYGGCKYNGASYTIDVNDPDQPLVRDDILKSELKFKKADVKAKKLVNDQANKEMKKLMFDMFGDQNG